jgi:MoaA/NifB/PqqE/SkfB family radical SAM enzyme
MSAQGFGQEAESAHSTKRKVDIIWNATVVCPFDCAKCCVSAAHVRIVEGEAWMSDSSLGRYVLLGPRPVGSANNWHYDVAARRRQAMGLELDLSAKMRVLDNLDGVNPKINLSGGDPLVVTETRQLVREIARRFGRQNLVLTATGVGLRMVDPQELAEYVGRVNVTFDGTPPAQDPNCATGYSAVNLREAARLADAGIEVRVEMPLTLQNIGQDELRRIWEQLTATKIGSVLLMRLFPVGRGELRKHQIPTRSDYLEALGRLRALESELGGPSIQLQCALRYLDPRPGQVNPCNAARESFGLMADGTLLGSPWAINQHGRPIDDYWVLGNLASESMVEILDKEKVRRLVSRADDNFGHCKIFSGLYGKGCDTEEKVFEASDPLYDSDDTVREPAA